MGWFQVIWYSWDELTPPTSDAKKTHPKKMVCIRICFVCTCMYICAYVDVRRCASILEPPKQRPSIWFWQCCKLSRIWQEKYQCGEEYSKHAEVRMGRISLSVCSLQTALMLFETEELEYCHTFCCTPAGLGTLVLEESPAKVSDHERRSNFGWSLVGLTFILSSEKTHSAGKESMVAG